jgi:hypothetical protein
MSLPSPLAYDGFDDPLSGSRLSFRGSATEADGSAFAGAHTFSEIQR